MPATKSDPPSPRASRDLDSSGWIFPENQASLALHPKNGFSRREDTNGRVSCKKSGGILFTWMSKPDGGRGLKNERSSVVSLLYLGLIDQHDRDVILDGIDPFALAALQSLIVRSQRDRFLA